MDNIRSAQNAQWLAYFIHHLLLPATNFSIVAQQLPFDSALFILYQLFQLMRTFFPDRDIDTYDSRWPALARGGEPRVIPLASHWEISKSDDGQIQRDEW